MSFIIVDAHNLFSRGRHVVRGDIDLKIGMCLHIMIASIKKCWSTLDGSHVVFAFDRRSWRKDFYPQYKFHRHEGAAAKTPQEQEEDKLFYESFNDFHKFISEKTNCTVLEQHGLEADDLIAGWIQHHPNSKHVIISTDTDFYQLLAPNVKQYNGVTEELHTLEGIFDKYGKPVIDNKTKQPKEVPDPKWMLFEKIIRGDSTDNIMSAYPGVRKKGSKNKVGLIEAFEDRDSQGYAWNNLMLSRWTDHNGEEHRVKDVYERNKTLIDLSAQPQAVKNLISEVVTANMVEKEVHQVGARMLRFCRIYDLKRISDNITYYVDPFNAKYSGACNE